ncbi:MAG: hypothetical protein ACXAEU_23510, partial [Candidatus Hodarchaeales archaeon]
KGMFQIMPNGWIKRDFADCDLFSRPCNVRTAVRALEYIRCVCISKFGHKCNVSTYVGGYGLSYFPRPHLAHKNKGPRRARKFLCDVKQDCDSVWPL